MLVFAAVAVLSAGTAFAQATSSGRTDGQIEMDVVRALDGSTILKDDLITAATIQSEVTLSGTVASQNSKMLAESIARGVPGVKAVHNNLTIGDPKQAAQDVGLSPDDQSDVAMNEPPAPPRNEPMPMPDDSQASAPPPSNYPAYPAPQSQPQYPQARPPYTANGAPPVYGQPEPSAQPPYGQPPYGQQPNGYPQQPAYPYPQQPAYPQQPVYPQQPAYPQQPTYEEYSSAPVTVSPGSLIQLRTSEPVDSKHAVSGTPVQFTVIQDVSVGGALAIPRGATVHGVVTDVRQSKQGDLTGSSALALTLTSIDLGGQTYSVQSDEFRVQSPGKGGQTANSAITGSIIGTIIGCAAGGGVGCAVGAGAGAAGGMAVGGAMHGPTAWIPAEAQATFHLMAPLTVTPVTPQEAARLAQGLYQGGPRLQQRPPNAPPYPYAYPYAASPYPYAAPYGRVTMMYGGYPGVYYRPYVMVGGGYVWR
jgi:hypothetical protein